MPHVCLQHTPLRLACSASAMLHSLIFVARGAPCEESVDEHTDVEFLSFSITFNHIVNIVIMMHRMRRRCHGVRHC